MAFSHPLDPPIQTAAASAAGKLVAQGILAEDDILPELITAALRAGYRGHRHGLQCRLTWALRDSADHWRRERDRAEFVIRRELAPMLDAWEEAVAIFRAGHAINERLQEPLLRCEVVGVVESEMAVRLDHLDRIERQQARQSAPHQMRRRRRNAR
jgi:hypothetical protein